MDGEIVTNTYNAEIAGVTPTKYMNVVTGYVNGFHAKNSVHFAVKIKGNWYLASDGYMTGKYTIGQQAIYTVNDVRLDDAADTDSPGITVNQGSDRWAGLSDGHEVFIACSHKDVWHITGIEKEFLSGTEDVPPAPFGEDYSWNNVIGWSLLPGVNVYGVYNAGQYDILAAGCGQEE